MSTTAAVSPEQTSSPPKSQAASGKEDACQPPATGETASTGTESSNENTTAGTKSGCTESASDDESDAIVKTEAQTPLPLFPDLLQEASIADAPHDVTIWSDIRQGFGLPADAARPRVQAELDWYTGHAAYLERVTARAEPYLYYILQQLQKRHMPTELALLPIVESAFIPYAYSRSRAAGIWQFTPATGLHFGLKQNWWYDGRRDIWASTNAALDYLQQLHDQFGSWLLALAAYNSGAGTVQAAIRYNQRRHRPTDFWSLDLPRETRHYVPKLLAVRAIVQDPKKYAVQLWPIPNKPYLAEVKLKSQIDLALAAKLADIPLKELYLLNPGYNRWATDPDGPYRLLLPTSRAASFETKLAKVPSRERVTWIRHRVRPGDTLSQIAAEYHTTIGIIRQSNHLNGNIIRAGHYLIVPRSSRPYRAYVVAEGQRRRFNPLPKGRGQKQTLTVRSGDTLWGIAQHYKVSVKQLARWNGISTRTSLRPGKKLTVWIKPRQYASASNTPAPSNPGHAFSYRIRQGDSLWVIARRYGVSVKQLARWNGISTHTPLHPGKKLLIRAKPAQYASISNIPRDERIRTVSYTVRQGDSLYSIAKHFGVQIPDIRRWNDLGHKSLLHPGQPLKLRVDVTQQQNES